MRWGAGLVTRKTGEGRSLGRVGVTAPSPVAGFGFDITFVPVPCRMWAIGRVCPIKVTGAQRFTTLALELISYKNQ